MGCHVDQPADRCNCMGRPTGPPTETARSTSRAKLRASLEYPCQSTKSNTRWWQPRARSCSCCKQRVEIESNNSAHSLHLSHHSYCCFCECHIFGLHGAQAQKGGCTAAARHRASLVRRHVCQQRHDHRVTAMM